MGVVHFEELKLRQREIEVRALVAMLDHSSKQGKIQVLTKLAEIAFPEKLAEQLEYETKQTTL